jgi:ribose transport system permease protein
MEKQSILRKTFKAKNLTLIVVLILVVIFFYLNNNAYLTANNIRTIFINATLNGTLACGVALILISGNTDLSTGSIGALGGVVVAMLLRTGMPWVPALALTVVMGMVLGLINAFFVNVMNFMPFITTLAAASVWEGAVNLLAKGRTVPISNQAFWKIGAGYIFDTIPICVAIMVVMFIIYGVILNRTRFGRRIYMCGGNRNAARLAGINPKKISAILYVNCSALAAFAGAVLAARMHTGSPISVIGTQYKAITAAVLGGVAFTGGSGSMFGCFIGLLLMNAFNNGLTVIGISAYTQVSAEGVLLIAALLLDYFRSKTRIKNKEA